MTLQEFKNIKKGDKVQIKPTAKSDIFGDKILEKHKQKTYSINKEDKYEAEHYLEPGTFCARMKHLPVSIAIQAEPFKVSTHRKKPYNHCYRIALEDLIYIPKSDKK